MNRFLPLAIAMILFISLASGVISLIALSKVQSEVDAQRDQNKAIQKTNWNALEFHLVNVESNCIVDKNLVAELNEKSRIKHSASSTAKRAKSFEDAYAACKNEEHTARVTLEKTKP